MRFAFSNVGRIRSGAVDLKDLTVICGRNNSGKTYATYAIHAFLRNFGNLARANIVSEYTDVLQKQGAVSLPLKGAFEHRDLGYKKASERLVENLCTYFSVSEDFFEDARIQVSAPDWLNEDGLLSSSAIFSGAGYRGVKESGSSELIITSEKTEVQLPASYARNEFGQWVAQAGIGFCLPTPFAITSERTGVSLFYKDLDLSRNRVIEKMLQAEGKEVNLFDLVLKNSSRYALPVRENIDAVRGYEAISKQRSFLMDEDPADVLGALDDLLGGGFAVEQEGLSYYFKIKGVRKRKRVPIYVASSAVKSLLLLNLFIRHQAASNSLLIIDEPELNLHPANQRKIAGLLVRLVNSGVRILMTTHSDFILREISARVALSSVKEDGNAQKYMKANGLTEFDLIDSARVGAFSADDGHVEPVPVTGTGIEVSSINNEIARANEFFEDVILFQ